MKNKFKRPKFSKKETKSNYFIHGLNNSISLIKSDKNEIINIFILENSLAWKNNKIQDLINDNKKICKIFNKELFFKKFDEFRTQGIVINFKGKILIDLPDFSNTIGNQCLLLLDRITDPQNLGQIIRTAECAGIDGIIIPKHNSAPINNTSLQVSQGAFASINIYEVTNLRNVFQEYKNNGFWVVGVENSINAKPWFETEYKGKVLIVLGSEGRGIRKKVLESCDFTATIPMRGETNSLNVSATASAILFERIRQIEGE